MPLRRLLSPRIPRRQCSPAFHEKRERKRRAGSSTEHLQKEFGFIMLCNLQNCIVGGKNVSGCSFAITPSASCLSLKRSQIDSHSVHLPALSPCSQFRPVLDCHAYTTLPPVTLAAFARIWSPR